MIGRVAIVLVALGVVVYGAALGAIIAGMGRRQVFPADAVVVLGTAARIDGRVNPCLLARLEEGIRLVREGAAGRLVVSGGADPVEGEAEAELMARIAVERGLEPDQVLVEPRATSTRENLEYSRRLLDEAGAESMIIVSEPFHLPRAALTARRLGIEHGVAPSASCRERRWWFLREPVALVWYWLTVRPAR